MITICNYPPTPWPTIIVGTSQMFAGQQVGCVVGAFTFAFHSSISFRTLDILPINFPSSCLVLLTTLFMTNSPLWVCTCHNCSGQQQQHGDSARQKKLEEPFMQFATAKLRIWGFTCEEDGTKLVLKDENRETLLPPGYICSKTIITIAS